MAKSWSQKKKENLKQSSKYGEKGIITNKDLNQPQGLNVENLQSLNPLKKRVLQLVSI